MKIVQIITELYPAGAEKVLLNLSIELKRRGYDLQVISLQTLPVRQKDIINELKANKIEVESLGITKLTPWRIIRLLNILKVKINNQPVTGNDRSPIILHSHLIHANLALRVAGIFLDRRKIRIINTIHTTEKRTFKWWHFILDKFTFKLCNTQTAISKATQQFYAMKTGIKPDRIPVIYNGIIPPNIPNSERIKNLKSEWMFDDCTKVIGSIGRLSNEKGFDILIDNIQNISALVPANEKWGIVILGEGKERSFLERKINRLKCNNIKINLPGYRKDAADCIGAFDLFIMPSRYEGFGLALIEAMSHGVPILCSKLDSLLEVLDNYSNCLSFSVGDNIEFIEKLKVVLEMKRCRNKISFTIESMVDKYISVYNLSK